ncbi:hypothetical protein RB195_023211 [Necator americanus]|uniref:Uncharacterized protein n=1 Tax=Necator americanus TaxID=51031 RepID=A0ABR1EJ79_NECAM
MSDWVPRDIKRPQEDHRPDAELSYIVEQTPTNRHLLGYLCVSFAALQETHIASRPVISVGDYTIYCGDADEKKEETTIVQTAAAAQIPKLPVIPIPTFTGKIWEFSNFWTLFDANVHQQPLTRLQKFNYLVNALRGEARELIRRYPIIDSNYDQAVDLLHSKYGNESALIGNLQLRLETAKAESGRIKAQRRLLETITPIVTQLQEQRVNLDGSYFSQKTLAKFSTTLQRQALQEYVSQNTQESDWKMSRTLSILDNLISTEEKINEMVNRNDRVGTTSTYQSEKSMRIPSQNVERSRGIRMMCRRVSRRLMSVVNCTARLLIPS